MFSGMDSSCMWKLRQIGILYVKSSWSRWNTHIFCIYKSCISICFALCDFLLVIPSTRVLVALPLLVQHQASFLLAWQQSFLLDQRSTQQDVVPCQDHQANCSSRAKPGCIDPLQHSLLFQLSEQYIRGNVCTGVSDVQSDLELPPGYQRRRRLWQQTFRDMREIYFRSFGFIDF